MLPHLAEHHNVDFGAAYTRICDFIEGGVNRGAHLI
jgi:hypothetical protein